MTTTPKPREFDEKAFEDRFHNEAVMIARGDIMVEMNYFGVMNWIRPIAEWQFNQDSAAIAARDQIIERLAEALKFYADSVHWVARDGGGGLRVEGFDCEDNKMIWGFSGRRARQALSYLEQCRKGESNV